MCVYIRKAVPDIVSPCCLREGGGWGDLYLDFCDIALHMIPNESVPG